VEPPPMRDVVVVSELRGLRGGHERVGRRVSRDGPPASAAGARSLVQGESRASAGRMSTRARAPRGCYHPRLAMSEAADTPPLAVPAEPAELLAWAVRVGRDGVTPA